MISYRPVLEVRAIVANDLRGKEPLHSGLLLFVGHHAVQAWGREGKAWQSEKLSSEGRNDCRHRSRCAARPGMGPDDR